MVVRGDGALVSADVAREKPIETILSGPAASVAGAQWLTGAQDALISDIGGTTTDVCLLRDGKPQIDPQGAQVGPYRTMVEAVAMRTSGLGGDSEVHVREGLAAGLHLGPRRVMPMALAATHYPQIVHRVLDQALAQATPAVDGGQIVIPLWRVPPEGQDAREAAIVARLADGPLRYGQAVTTRMEAPALGRLMAQGVVILAGVTPSDAAHVLGRVDAWDAQAAEKALALFARKRTGGGERLAADGTTLAAMIIDQLTGGGADQFSVHLADGVQMFTSQDTALAALEAALRDEAGGKAKAAGVDDIRFTIDRDVKTATVEGQTVFIEATLQVTALGRPRIALS